MPVVLSIVYPCVSLFFSLSPFPLARHIYRTAGLRGLYVGFTGVLTKAVLGFGAMLGMYDLSRSTLTPTGQAKDDAGRLR